MKWENSSTKRATVLEAKTKLLRVVVVRGHVDEPNQWLLSTNPDILNGFCRMGEEMTLSEAKDKAENIVRNRLNAMVIGLDA